MDAFKEANSFPAEVLHGCILTGDPDCRQLVYPNGLDSVYEKDGGLSLPATVVFIIRNLAGGGMAVYVANFLPTPPAPEP